MKFIMALALRGCVLVALILYACTPSPLPVTPIDASDAAAYYEVVDAAPDPDAPNDAFAIACLNLRAVGCPEGDNPLCADTMRRAQTARLVNFAPSCVAMQKTAEAIRACAPAWKNGCRGARSSQ